MGGRSAARRRRPTAWRSALREFARHDRDAAGLAELRGLRLALASRARRGRRTLPALRRGARVPQARSFQRTWAYLIAAAICYIPANVLPVLTTTTAAGAESDTILQGVVLLWSPTGWPLSIIVLVASIMIPSAKILALGYLLITAQRGSVANNEQRVRMYRMVEFIGRWSMVDVFVDTFTAALIQLQPLMSVEPGPGLIFFAAVVVFTMLAVEVVRSAADLGLGKSGKRPIRKRSPMPESDPPRPSVPDSRTVPRRRTRLSLVWFIPILAAVVGAWVAVTRVLSEGPEITIVLKSAEGLEAGKTKIHYNGVDIGTVTTIDCPTTISA